MPPVLRFAAVYSVIEPIFGPQVFGGMFRSALGKALKEINPVAYRDLFAPEPRPELGRQFNNPPPPLYIDVTQPAGGFVRSGEQFEVVISLVGEAAALIEILIDALFIAGRTGFGKTSASADLLEVRCLWPYGADELSPIEVDPEPPYIEDVPTAAAIVLTSPFRKTVSDRGAQKVRKTTPRIIPHDGDSTLSRKSFSAGVWIDAIRQRIALLDVAYGDAREFDPGPKSPRLKINRFQLFDVHQFHYSSRSKSEQDVSGVMGSFRLPISGIEEHWPYIWAGQWYQVGARPNIGLGAYQVLIE